MSTDTTAALACSPRPDENTQIVLASFLLLPARPVRQSLTRPPPSQQQRATDRPHHTHQAVWWSVAFARDASAEGVFAPLTEKGARLLLRSDLLMRTFSGTLLVSEGGMAHTGRAGGTQKDPLPSHPTLVDPPIRTGLLFAPEDGRHAAAGRPGSSSSSIRPESQRRERRRRSPPAVLGPASSGVAH